MTSTPIAAAKYVWFTTFRKDGTPVSTPVWIAPLGDGTLGFMTNDNVGKTKRLAHTARVTLQECDVRGRVSPGAPVVDGTAVVVRDDAGQARVRAAVEKKYGLLAKGFSIAQVVGTVLPFLKPAPRAAVVVTLT
jgi:PPOX class probable F420-dependent enzyme